MSKSEILKREIEKARAGYRESYRELREARINKNFLSFEHILDGLEASTERAKAGEGLWKSSPETIANRIVGIREYEKVQVLASIISPYREVRERFEYIKKAYHENMTVIHIANIEIEELEKKLEDLEGIQENELETIIDKAVAIQFLKDEIETLEDIKWILG